MSLAIEDTALPGVQIITPRRFGDNRGAFSETYNAKTWADLGISTAFVQDNHSKSSNPGTVRGLHFQSPPNAQAKLVRVIAGAILDVAVDIRVGSPTYGKWVGVELSAENGRQLLIPDGFLHGFVTLSPDVEVLYKCSDTYAPQSEGSVRFDDPDLGIDWGIPADKATLSDKDAKAPSFADLKSPFVFDGQKELS